MILPALPNKKSKVSKGGWIICKYIGGGWFPTLPITISILVWNCCGLGNLCTKREFIEIIQAQDPFVLFIPETWTNEAGLDHILSNINFDHKMGVPRVSRGGDLVLFWKASVNLLVKDSHMYFIDALINKNTEAEWRFIGFYGEPNTFKRQDAWQHLRILNNHPNISWLCAEDFNEITK